MAGEIGLGSDDRPGIVMSAFFVFCCTRKFSGNTLHIGDGRGVLKTHAETEDETKKLVTWTLPPYVRTLVHFFVKGR